MVESDLSEYRDDLVAIESRVAREVETGWRGPAIAAAVTVLVIGLALPHTGTGAVPGWSVATAAHSGAGVPLRVFTGFAIVFGVVVSTVAATTRRWVAAWIAMAGTGLGTLLGMFAYWSQQAMPGTALRGGAGIGLMLTWAAMAALAVLWIPIVASRSNILPPPGDAGRPDTTEN
ncbi:Rv2732c family membrane protein [Rhodococcus opacus]|nr:hypothetical protein [Rhodococcus opacus]